MNSETKKFEITMTYDDPQTVFSVLWFRVGYTTIAWLIMGFWDEPYTKNFFITLLLFASPLLMDYLRFKPINNKIRSGIKYIGVTVSALWILFSILGMSSFFRLNKSQLAVDEDHLLSSIVPPIPVIMIWALLGLSVALTIVDAIVYRSKAERKVGELLRDEVETERHQFKSNSAEG
ncbi:hypothetical protein BLX87_23215 [Bacillus sp. VT-16-64]|nr:hypothetical protein BLX87_23215 [Bacillus sp. VT-16-64]